MTAPCAVVVLAKAPVPGFAKSRLVPALGAEGAAALAERMLVHTVGQARAADLGGGVDLCCAPDPRHPAFQSLAQQAGVALSRQSDGDLGERMRAALDRHLDKPLNPREPDNARALLVGIDAPTLDAATMRRAAAALDDADAVFVPTLDGGYVLVGLRAPQPRLFEGMTWSTTTVMTETRRRAHEVGLRWVELEPLADIDVPDDLAQLPKGWIKEPR